MSELIVREVLVPRPGREAALEAALRGLFRAEFAAARPHGVLSFALRREKDGSRWLMEERWAGRAEFDAFHANHRPPELLDFLAKADDLLAEPLDRSVSFWETVDDPGGLDDRRDAERALVERVFDRIAALDVDGLMALFAEDGRQAMPYAPEGFPVAFEGRDELDRNYRTLLGGYVGVSFPDLAIKPLVEPGRWLATYRTDIAFRDGRRYRNRYVALFTLRDGAIAEWTEFFDPAVLTRELGNPFAEQGVHTSPRDG